MRFRFADRKLESLYTTGTDDSAIDSNDLLSAVQYPDPSTGEASSDQQETCTYDGQGSVVALIPRCGECVQALPV
jgi:hypothetical protein